MPSLKNIRSRITSVKNTQQITRAMKLVSAAKLRRAQEAVTAARPYADHLAEILWELLQRSELDPDVPAPHPLLQRRDPIRRVELLVLTSDRGLCGSFNVNITRRANRFLFENADVYDSILVSTAGRKGHEWARRNPAAELQSHYEGITSDVDYRNVEQFTDGLAQRFVERELDAVFLLYTRFHSAIRQELVLSQLLPVSPTPPSREAEPEAEGGRLDFKYEPDRDSVLRTLVPRYLATQLYQAILESAASEQGARMTAMDNATRNAGDMIDRLTLMANRTRQAAITTELMEIVSGAEALK